MGNSAKQKEYPSPKGQEQSGIRHALKKYQKKTHAGRKFFKGTKQNIYCTRLTW